VNTISFEGQVAIVTGAGRAIGRAHALELARRGASVVVNDVGGVIDDPSGPWADQVVAEVERSGGRAVASHDSVMTPEGGEAIVNLAVECFGTVDVLINNAGFLRPAPFEDLSLQQIHDVVDVHLLASFYVTQPAWRIMQAKRYGRVVLTSSPAAFGNRGSSNYVAAKTALLGLGRALSLEGAKHGICVNSILPYATSRIAVDNPLPADGDTLNNRVALDALKDGLAPESVTALVILLASRECLANGRAYSCLAGRYARVFLGVTNGWLSPDLSPSTPELIRDHFADVEDDSSFIVPESLSEEIMSVFERVRQSSPTLETP
jgi:NAD(P)-dependent dehydrogenase (short-subunit alcohol dehydrogenase family)